MSRSCCADGEGDISYETVRRWVLKFGPGIARRLRQRRPRPSDRWHFDEMVVRIAGRRMYLWRAVDHEGEILDMLVSAGVKARALRLVPARATPRLGDRCTGFPPSLEFRIALLQVIAHLVRLDRVIARILHTVP